MAPLEGSTQTLTLFLYNCHLDRTGAADDFKNDQSPGLEFIEKLLPWKETVGLQVQVQRFIPREGREGEHSLALHDSDSFQIRTIPAEFHAIPEELLPTVQELEDWAMNTVITYHTEGFLGGLRGSFFSFAHRHSQSTAEIPLVSQILAADAKGIRP